MVVNVDRKSQCKLPVLNLQSLLTYALVVSINNALHQEGGNTPEKPF